MLHILPLSHTYLLPLRTAAASYTSRQLPNTAHSTTARSPHIHTPANTHALPVLHAAPVMTAAPSPSTQPPEAAGLYILLHTARTRLQAPPQPARYRLLDLPAAALAFQTASTCLALTDHPVHAVLFPPRPYGAYCMLRYRLLDLPAAASLKALALSFFCRSRSALLILLLALMAACSTAFAFAALTAIFSASVSFFSR